MTGESQSSDASEQTGGVSMGNVEGGVHASTIVGRDVIQQAIQHQQIIHVSAQAARQLQGKSIAWQVLIAHADGEEHLAEQLAEPIRDAGYEIAYQGTVVKKGVIVEEASKVLSAGGPVVLCGTVKGVGTGWADRLVNTARQRNRQIRVFAAQMEKDAYVQTLALDGVVALYWQDPAKAAQDLIASLEKYYPLYVGFGYDPLAYDAEQRYRELALKSCDIINLANLPEHDRHIATRHLELRRLYVALRVQVEIAAGIEVSETQLEAIEERRRVSLGRGGLDTGQGDGPDRKAVIDRISVGLRLAEARRIVILGDPGAGKTTLLRWIATAYLLRLKQDPDWKDLPDVETLPDEDWLPIIVRCRNLTQSCLRGSLDDILRHTLRKTELTEDETAAFQVVLREKLRQGEALLLIDGLDEITEPAPRARFCQQLERIHDAYPDAPIIVTSRIVGYREMGYRIGRGFEHVTIADLSKEDKDDFARRWCAVTELPERREAAIEELIHDVHSSDRIERLTGNPMLLTTLALVKRKVGKLPSRRADLYWEAVQVLLNWRREVDEPIDHREAIPQLEYLAYEMCDRGIQQIREDEIIGLFERMREEYPQVHTVRKHTANEFLRLLESRTGILVEAGFVRHGGEQKSVFEFRHLTFQEYIAGLSLVKGHFPGRNRSQSLAEYVAPLAGRTSEVEDTKLGTKELAVTENWREALRLCVASCNEDDVDSVLMAILNPLEGEDAQSMARPRAVLATLCLADDPNASETTVRDVLTRFAEQIGENDGGGSVSTSLDVTALEMVQTKSHWLEMFRSVLVEEFRRRDRAGRADVGSLCGMVVAGTAPSDDATLRDWFLEQTSRIASSEEATAIDAALGIMHMAYDRKALVVPGMANGLLSMLTKSAPAAMAAAWALGWLNDEVLKGNSWRPLPLEMEQIISAISDPTLDLYAVRFLAWLLGRERERDARAVKPLVMRLQEQDVKARQAVVTTLGKIRDVQAVEPLTNMLADQDPIIRQVTARALGQIGAPQATESLIASLKDPDSAVRQSAADALSQIGDTRAVEPLIDALEDRDSGVQLWVALALGLIGTQPGVHKQLKDATFCERLTQSLIVKLDDQDSGVQQWAAWALGLIGVEIKDNTIRMRVVERLVARLTDQNSAVRRFATEALGKIKSTQAVGPLIVMLNDQDSALQQAAAKALGQIKGMQSVEPLIAKLAGRDSAVREATMQALGEIGDARAVEPLIAMLQSTDSTMRQEATKALGQIRDARGGKPLLSRLGDPSIGVRQEALKAWSLTCKKDRTDRRLLSRNLDGVKMFLDPQQEIVEERVHQAAERLRMSVDDVRRRYEALAEQIPLKLAWLPCTTPPANL